MRLPVLLRRNFYPKSSVPINAMHFHSHRAYFRESRFSVGTFILRTSLASMLQCFNMLMLQCVLLHYAFSPEGAQNQRVGCNPNGAQNQRVGCNPNGAQNQRVGCNLSNRTVFSSISQNA